jgi:TetR/AcrR family transcriptional repressor of nem operon
MAYLSQPQGESTRERILETTEKLILAQGYVGTSIDDIIKVAGLTKGGFFYHFKNKAELGRAVVERYAAADFELFERLSQQADAATDDPLDSLLMFLALFEDFIGEMQDPPGGCIFASYIYESSHFDDQVKQYIADGFAYWGDMYVRRIEAVKAMYPPVMEVDSRELSETIMCIIEGGFILAKSLDEAQVVSRTSRHFRNYLQLIFKPASLVE